MVLIRRTLLLAICTLAGSLPSFAQAPLPDLVVKSSGPLAAKPGDRLVYVTTITNVGTAPATDVVATHTITSGLVFVSNTGDCATAWTCPLGTLAPSATKSITTLYDVPAGAGTMPKVLEHEVSATLTGADAVTWNNMATATTGLNAYERYFAEGASNSFFETLYPTFNPNAQTVTVLYRIMRPDGTIFDVVPLTIEPMHRLTLSAASVAGGGAYSMQVASTLPIAVERLMTWDNSSSITRYGSTADNGVGAPSLVWHFAEGATGPFQLFLLLANPSTEAATGTATFLTTGGGPVVQPFTVGGLSRVTIPVHDIPGLAWAEVSTTLEVTNNVPIIADRAMYKNVPGQVFGAGHASSGASALSPSWFFGEGATGSFFDTFLLLANPGTVDSTATVTYQLPGGEHFSKDYPVPSKRRVSIGVDGEDARLASTSVAMSVSATQPIMAERAMWWPGTTGSDGWYEAHAVLGSTITAPRWAVASGSARHFDEEVTYVLISNTGSESGAVKVTVVMDGLPPVVRTIALGAHTRHTIDVATDFPETWAANNNLGSSFSVLIESVGTPLPLVVERSHYASPKGVFWAAGDATLATPVP